MSETCEPGNSDESYLSITCTTPFATKTSGVMTFASFTKTLPLSMVIVNLPPLRVVKLVPFLSVELYPTVPLTTAKVVSLDEDSVSVATYRDTQGYRSAAGRSGSEGRSQCSGTPRCLVRTESRRPMRRQVRLDWLCSKHQPLRLGQPAQR